MDPSPSPWQPLRKCSAGLNPGGGSQERAGVSEEPPPPTVEAVSLCVMGSLVKSVVWAAGLPKADPAGAFGIPCALN